MKQLTIDEYQRWQELEAKWRLTEDELKLVNLSYTWDKRGKELTSEMRYLRNTKAREYRRVKTFDRYLAELDRQAEKQKTKRTQRKNGLCKGTLVKPEDSPLTVVMKNRVRQTYARAMEEGIPFDLDLAFLVQLAEESNQCPVCLTPLVYIGEHANAQLDKHTPALGYTKENVNFLCAECNRLKSNHTEDTLRRLAAYIGIL